MSVLLLCLNTRFHLLADIFFRIEKLAETFGQKIYELSSQVTALTDLRTVRTFFILCITFYAFIGKCRTWLGALLLLLLLLLQQFYIAPLQGSLLRSARLMT